MQLCNEKTKSLTQTGMESTYRYKHIALLIAFACVLQISESMIPHPVPGLRLGLANMVTLVALVRLGFGFAFEIAIFRAVLSSLITGTFMSPTFILSFSGAVTSTLVMGLLFRISRYHYRFGFSIIGISIVGALTHNMIQLSLAYLILVKHSGIFIFFPVLCYGAVGMGTLTGLVAASVCRKLETPFTVSGFPPERNEREAYQALPGNFVPGNSILHQLPAELKILFMFGVSPFILFVDSYRVFMGLAVLLAIIVLSSGVSFAFLLSKARRYKILILTALVLPVLFNTGSHIIVDLSFFALTREGLNAGGLLSIRILFLILCSTLLIGVTGPDELARGLGKLLSPIRHLGMSQERTAGIIVASWTAFPAMWETTRCSIRKARLSESGKIRPVVDMLSHLIADLYRNLETMDDSPETSSSKTNRDSGTDAPGTGSI